MAEEKDTTKNEAEKTSVESVSKEKAAASPSAKAPENKSEDKSKEVVEKAVEKADIDSDKKNEKTETAPRVLKKKKRKIRRQVQRGCAYIRSSYNNTVVSLTDLHGNLLAWSSSGLLGFKGAKKATTYAATQVVMDVDERVQKYGLKDIEVYIKGVGGGREAALRALAQKGYNISRIKDITPIPHNGCRPKKPRRV